MSTKKINHCFLCGTEYEVCKYCRQVVEYTPWRQQCDSMRHFQIYMIVKDIRSGGLKPAEAKEQLEHLKVTPDEIKTFVPSVQKTLLPIFETKPDKKLDKTVESEKKQPKADIADKTEKDK